MSYLSQFTSGGRWKSQTFTSSGWWIKPSNVEVVNIILVGGGGGGGGTTTTGADGGTSYFGDIVSRPGERGNSNGASNGRGGTGGGRPRIFGAVETHSYYGEATYGTSNGNGGPARQPGGTGISSGESVSGGGGGGSTTYSYCPGGTVIGFGNGGEGYPSARSSGGGASFGDGGNGALTVGGYPSNGSNATHGGGGGSANFGAGGGGGELVIRQVPVYGNVYVTIGGGGGPGYFYYTYWNGSAYVGGNSYGGLGGNGICIVFWVA